MHSPQGKVVSLRVTVKGLLFSKEALCTVQNRGRQELYLDKIHGTFETLHAISNMRLILGKSDISHYKRMGVI